ncbi:unnamed protein product [Boreogadus saida]
MGHNLGLSHDAPGCVCRSSQPQSGCIKAPSHGKTFSRFISESGRTYFRLSPLYYVLFCLEICLHIAPRHCTT